MIVRALEACVGGAYLDGDKYGDVYGRMHESSTRGDDSPMTTATDTTLLPTVKEAARSLGISREAAYRLVRSGPDVLFVCGSSRNRDRFLPYFTKIFNLRIDDDTMRRRLQERTDDDWPLGQAGVELMVELNRNDERPAGAIDIDATRPLDQVVDELLRLARVESHNARSDARRSP